MRTTTIAALTAALTFGLATPASADDGLATHRVNLATAQQGTSAAQYRSKRTSHPRPGWTRWRLAAGTRITSLDLVFHSGTEEVDVHVPGWRAAHLGHRWASVDVPSGFVLTYGGAEVLDSPNAKRTLSVVNVCTR